MTALEQLADRVSAAIWSLHPRWAVEAGKHEYDGVVPDGTPEAEEAALERLDRLRTRIIALADLDPDEQIDRDRLLGLVDLERFEAEVVGRRRRDPGWCLEALDVSVYLERDYAPAGLRLERAAAVLDEAGSLLAAVRSGLEEVLPRPWVEAAMTAARRRASRLGAPRLPIPDGADSARWAEAAGRAAGELESYGNWLEGERLPAASPGFGVGGDGVAAWLGASEARPTHAAALAAGGAARLEEDREALLADASALAPGLSLEGACRRFASAGAVADTEAYLAGALEEARHLVASQDLAAPVAVPRIEVIAGTGEEAGWLQAPGAYDDAATDPVLFASSGWAPAALNELVVGAACPGRLVALRHAARAPGEVRRRFPARGLIDGWRLYAGDLMAEAGYRDRDPGWRLLWRRRVVLADCRLALGPRLWAGDLSLEEAQETLGREAGLAAPAARTEALRLAADPGCWSGALGRAEILRWRRRWEAAGRAGAGHRAFHEALLSPGALPLGTLEGRLP